MSFKKQCRTAREFLKNEPDGTKLTFSAKKVKGKLIPRKGKKGVEKFALFQEIERLNQSRPRGKKLHQITQSFVKLDGEYYAVGELLGEGTFGKVKLLKDKDGQVFALKKEILDPAKKINTVSAEELEALKDFGLSPIRHPINYLKSRQDSNNTAGYFTRMAYLGESLDKVLARPLDNETRYDIGIELCLEIHRLHCVRDKSLSKTAYAHRDIKLANATWKNGKIHLIDFGMIDKYPKGKTEPRGTPHYAPGPYPRGSSKIGIYTGEESDIFALKRCLVMPTSFYCCTTQNDGYVKFSKDEAAARSILNEAILTENPDLAAYLDTSSPQHPPVYQKNKNISACSLAAMLIVAKLKIAIDAKILANDQIKALAITGIYSHSKTPKEEIEKVLRDESQIKAHAAFAETGNYEKFAEFMGEPAFFEAMEKAKTHEHACALVFLRSQGIRNYEGLKNKKIVSAVHKLYKLPKVVWDVETLNQLMQYEGLVTIINEADIYLLQVFFQKATAPDYKEAYTTYDLPIISEALRSFSNFRPDDPSKGPEVFRALCIELVLKLGHMRAISSVPFLARAIINLNSNSVCQWGVSIKYLLSIKEASLCAKIAEAYNIGVEHVKNGGSPTDLPADLSNINNAKAVCFLSKNQCDLPFDPDRAEDLAFLHDIKDLQCNQKELENFLKLNRDLKQHSPEEVLELFNRSKPKSKLPQQEENLDTPFRVKRSQDVIVVSDSDSDSDSESESMYESENESSAMDSGFLLDCCSQLSCGQIIGFALLSLILLVSIAGIGVATLGTGLLGAAAGAVLTASIVGAAVSGGTLLTATGCLFFSKCRKESEEAPAFERVLVS